MLLIRLFNSHTKQLILNENEQEQAEGEKKISKKVSIEVMSFMNLGMEGGVVNTEATKIKKLLLIARETHEFAQKA